MKNMKKGNKLAIAFVLALALIIASPVIVSAIPEIDQIPDLTTSCELGAGIGGLIERFFPRLGQLIQSIGCVTL